MSDDQSFDFASVTCGIVFIYMHYILRIEGHLLNKNS